VPYDSSADTPPHPLRGLWRHAPSWQIAVALLRPVSVPHHSDGQLVR
jgi:hypothetical protein